MSEIGGVLIFNNKINKTSYYQETIEFGIISKAAIQISIPLVRVFQITPQQRIPPKFKFDPKEADNQPCING